MKILLFNPPGPNGRGFTREGRCTQEAGMWGAFWPPVSLASAASMLEKAGHEISVIDFPAANLGIPALQKTIARVKPAFAIWSTGTPTLPFDLQVAGLVKKESPETVTAVVGTHVTVASGEALREPGLDIVIRGEPEKIILELCSKGLSNREAVRGISYKQQSGEIAHNLSEDFLKPDEIPAPAWHCMDTGPYRLPLKGRPFLIVSPSRGCPYSCSFCTAPIYYGNRLRERPVEKVIDEIERNASRYGVKDFFIWSDTFTANNNYVRQFCRAIGERNLQVSWTCNSRVDTVTGDLLQVMRDAGLWMISFGIESSSDHVLERAGKRITADQSSKAVRSAHRAGIKTAGHFIFGLPGETEKTMIETLELALELPLDIAQFYAAVPFPGTRLHDEALRNGWLIAAEGVRSCSQGNAGMDMPGLPAERVNAFRQHAYRKFYSRPRALFNLLAMVEPGAVRLVPAAIKRFVASVKSGN